MVKACSYKHVAVRVNLGRNKILSNSGVLSGIYPALFTVKPDDTDFLGKTAYSYSDVLWGSEKTKQIQYFIQKGPSETSDGPFCTAKQR